MDHSLPIIIMMPEHRSSTAIKEEEKEKENPLAAFLKRSSKRVPKLVTARFMALAALARKFSYISVAFPATLSFLIRAASGYYTVSPVAGLSNFTVIICERLASTRGHRSKILHTWSYQPLPTEPTIELALLVC